MGGHHINAMSPGAQPLCQDPAHRADTGGLRVVVVAPELNAQGRTAIHSAGRWGLGNVRRAPRLSLV